MASLMFVTASSRVRPWEMQPGSAGTSATYTPSSSGSRSTRYFTTGSPPGRCVGNTSRTAARRLAVRAAPGSPCLHATPNRPAQQPPKRGSNQLLQPEGRERGGKGAGKEGGKGVKN